MWASFTGTITWLFSLSSAQHTALVLDITALALSLTTVIVVGGRILFGDPVAAQVMVADRSVQSRIFTIFIIEVVLQTMKVPILFKIAMSVVVIFISLPLLLGFLGH